jgi:hypothetical protein
MRLQVDTPHDFSIEALPARSSDAWSPVVEIRNGTWLFHTGANDSWLNYITDESSFTAVTVPHDWRAPPTRFG